MVEVIALVVLLMVVVVAVVAMLYFYTPPATDALGSYDTFLASLDKITPPAGRIGPMAVARPLLADWEEKYKATFGPLPVEARDFEAKATNARREARKLKDQIAKLTAGTYYSGRYQIEYDLRAEMARAEQQAQKYQELFNQAQARHYSPKPPHTQETPHEPAQHPHLGQHPQFEWGDPQPRGGDGLPGFPFDLYKTLSDPRVAEHVLRELQRANPPEPGVVEASYRPGRASRPRPGDGGIAW